MRLTSVAISALRRVEYYAGRARQKLDLRAKRARSAGTSRLDKPNDALAWEDVYLGDINPVTSMHSPVALAIADLTAPGDVLLEAGCGSGSLSAELATAGRVIELCDFSPRILERAKELFRVSGLPAPRCTICDVTQPLPWADDAVDAVWSSGVLEHWTDEELVPILKEMARISRKRVISLVPYAGCFAYRLGKHVAEEAGQWPYGRELPRYSLAQLFRNAGLVDIQERALWSEQGIGFLRYLGYDLQFTVRSWWESLPEDDPIKSLQGYLLLTVGEKPNSASSRGFQGDTRPTHPASG